MKRGLFILNKRAESLILSPVLFIILNLIVFMALLAFVVKSSTGAVVYEEAYAKQIALLLDKAKPGMQIQLDFEKGLKIAEKNKYAGKIVSIDKENNEVIVKLALRGGYGFKYFSDYDVVSYFNKNILVIIVDEKKGNKNAG